MELSEALIALIGTVFGGAGLKLIEHRLQNRKSRKQVDSTPSELRDELRSDLRTIRDELEKVRTEMNGLEDEVDAWRKKYWDLYETFIKAQQDWENTLLKIKRGDV